MGASVTHAPCRDCEIKYDAHAGESITFCPLHEAAGELLGALKELEALRKMPHPSGDLNAAVAYRQRERDAVALSKAAIAKAESH